MIVDDIERPGATLRLVERREGQRHVVGLEQRALDVLGMRGLEQRVDYGTGVRPGRTEQLDLVAVLDQRVAEQGNDELDAAVAGWRNRYPRRCKHRNMQARLRRALRPLSLRYSASIGGERRRRCGCNRIRLRGLFRSCRGH